MNAARLHPSGGGVTCPSVDKEADDHAESHHQPPGFDLLPLHTVEHRHAADVTLRTETVGGGGEEDGGTLAGRTVDDWIRATWKPKQMVGMALKTAVQDEELGQTHWQREASAGRTWKTWRNEVLP